VIALLASPLARWLLVAGAFAALALGAYVQTLRLDAARLELAAAQREVAAQAAHIDAQRAALAGYATSAAQARAQAHEATQLYQGAVARIARARASGGPQAAAQEAADYLRGAP